MSYFGIPIRNGLPIGLGTVAPLGINTFSPFSPASFFANGEQGWWYDPSNFATLFQDSAGTTPVTAVEQPVGLQLDLSKGLVLGPENVAFPIAGSFGASYTVVGDTIVRNGSTGTAVLTAASTIPATTKTYLFTFTVTNHSGDPTGVRVGGGTAYGPFSGNGTFTLRVPGGGATGAATFLPWGGGAGTATYSNISVKELLGNHRFQTTSANRPVVSARVNLLTKTEDFSNAAWTVQGATKTTGVLAPDGTTTAVTIAITSNTGVNFFQLLAGLPSESRIATAMVKGTAGQQVFFAADDSTPQTLVTFTGDWQTVSNTQTASGNVYFCFEIFNRSGGAALPNVTFSVWHPDLRSATQGVGLPAYQRVNTSTDYDSTGFPTYIKPNGSNQFMVTNSINFSSTDKMTVWQGVRKLSDAATGRVAEISVNAAVNAGAFAITAPEGAASNYGFFLRGDTGYPGYSATTFAAPVTNVLSVAYDISGAAIADEIKPRINGATPTLGISAAGPAGGGNFGTYPAYFYMRAGSSLPFGGNDYGSIARGAASTAAQITAGETYINSKTKAYT